jgi:hypothetical protein
MANISQTSGGAGARSHIPTVVLALGWAGVLPFAALSALAILGPREWTGTASGLLVSYGAIILGFMGGAQWGLEMSTGSSRSAGSNGYAVSVLPALVAFGATALPFRFAAAVLIAGFAGLLAYDLWRLQSGIGPRWYGPLRSQLTLAVVTALSAAAVFSA